jgi:hypothetical protein
MLLFIRNRLERPSLMQGRLQLKFHRIILFRIQIPLWRQHIILNFPQVINKQPLNTINNIDLGLFPQVAHILQPYADHMNDHFIFLNFLKILANIDQMVNVRLGQSRVIKGKTLVVRMDKCVVVMGCMMGETVVMVTGLGVVAEVKVGVYVDLVRVARVWGLGVGVGLVSMLVRLFSDCVLLCVLI